MSNFHRLTPAAAQQYEAAGKVMPPGYTWHHASDASTMQLVPSELNNVRDGGIAHTGGNAITEAAIEQLFNRGGFMNSMNSAKTFVGAGCVALANVFAANTTKADDLGQGSVGVGVDILDTIDPGVQDIFAGLWWLVDQVTDLDLGGFSGAPQLSDAHDTWFGGED